MRIDIGSNRERYGSELDVCCCAHVLDTWLILDGSEPGANAEAEDWNESSSGTEQENTGTELFWLDYQADNGQITSLIVHKEDKPEVIVQRVAEKNALDSAMRAALLARVGQEMDKRCDKC
ncbi:UPF0561 protein C2orf68 homolog [Sinocyclocheilus grahami]|uniref:UPF0561 protein C2orf68 homolog n=1 Tax=Sinocyclocheilus grahami TaxID=75366 RepID=UPI0007ACB722|nr:PREDICTED: UPF0561 protein C2orf68 homolog [Sinocyclocheilus grahami]